MSHHVKQGPWNSMRLPVAAVSLCVALSACSAQPEQTPASAPAAAPAAAAAPETAASASPRYDLKGKVVAVDKATKMVTVDHGDIPGFMSAMTMPYAVKDEALLNTLAPGDVITAKVAAEGGYHLEDVVVTTKAPPAK